MTVFATFRSDTNYANEIVRLFPLKYNKYIEPFVGTGAIIAILNPTKAIAGDTIEPLISMWIVVQNEPDKLINHYEKRIIQYYRNREKT